MNYKKARAWQDILLFGGAFVAGVGVWGFDSTFLGLLGLAMVLLSILVWWLYYRCPQCHESLGRGNPKHCPHCGAWLGDEPEPEEEEKDSAQEKEKMKTQTIPAYAKLNLTLDILGKRDDGYHELRMVMQTVSLCDDVTVTLTDGTGVAAASRAQSFRATNATLPSRPANAFCEALGYHGGIDITLTKRIPSEAGMGGRQRGCCRRAVRAARSDRPYAHGRAA